MAKMKQSIGEADIPLADANALIVDNFSFEDYFACKFEEATFDRRGACLVCRKATGEAVKFDTKNIHCHKSCLNLLLFYEFLNHVEVKLFEEASNNNNASSSSSNESKAEESSISLDTLLDVNILTRYVQGERIKCCACSLKHAYFKCAVEQCPNFIHENCSDDGLIVVNVGGSNPNWPHYRFLVCSEHRCTDDINMVKRRFLSKLSLTNQYKEAVEEYQRNIKLREETLLQLDAASSSQNEASRQGKPWTSYSGRTISPPKRLDNFMTSINNNGVATRSSGVGNPMNNAAVRCGHRVQQINTLMVEYSATRKQKAPKKIEWWHYDILFTPLHPDIFEFGGAKAKNRWDAELYEDIYAMFACKWSISNATDLKRVLTPCEYALREICNAVALHLNPQNGCQLEGGFGSDASCSSSVAGDPEVEADAVLARAPMVSSCSNGIQENEALSLSGASLTPYAFHTDHSRHDLVGFGSCRPKFVLANMGNSRAAWISCALTKRRETKKVLMLEYIPLSLLESEYLRRILHFTVLLNSAEDANATMAVPILYKEPKELPKEETLNNLSDSAVSKVNFCGFTWDEVPPLYKLFVKALGDGKSTRLDDDQRVTLNGCNESSRKVDLNGMTTGTIDQADVADLIGRSKEIETVFGSSDEHGFVTRQTIALLLALNSVNRALETCKVRLKAKIATEAFSYGRRHTNVTLVEQYKDAADHMRRWSHFRKAFVQSIDRCNYIMEMEKSQGVLGEGGKIGACSFDDASEIKSNPASDTPEVSEAVPMKEYCSICLQSELSRKHALLQCAKCCIRVHNRCYGTYTTALPVDSNSEQRFKQDEANSLWLCEPCKYESNITPRIVSSCNTAICCICSSSAGAMKRVAASALLSKSGMNACTLWVHLHCVVFFMPAVTCQDWYALSMWDLRTLQFTMDKCDICSVSGGVLINCAERECTGKFHPTCAWMSGCFVEHSCLYNSCLAASLLKTDCSFREIFPSICVIVHCLDHSIRKFSATSIARQRERRCFAYTHYQYQPDGYGRERGRLQELPLAQVYSPVSVTREGPIKTPQSRRNEIKSVPEYACRPDRPRGDYFTRPLGVTPAPLNAAVSVARPRYSDRHAGVGAVAAATMPRQKPGPPVYYGFTFPFTMDPPKYGIHAITSYLTKSNIAPQPPLRPSGREEMMLKPQPVPLVMPGHNDVRVNGHNQQQHAQAVALQAHVHAQQMAYAQYMQHQQQQQQQQPQPQRAHAIAMQAQQMAHAQYLQQQQQAMQAYQQQQVHAQQMAHAQYLQQQQQAMQAYQQHQAALQARGAMQQQGMQQSQRQPKQRSRQRQQQQQQQQQQWNQSYGSVSASQVMGPQHLVPTQAVPIQPQIIQSQQLQPQQLSPQQQQQQPQQGQAPYGFDNMQDENKGLMYITTRQPV